MREQLKADQLNVRLAENAFLPDLRAVATYDVNSIGSRIDGANTGSTGNAFRNLASDHFNDCMLGLRLNVPLGYRNAYANVRIAKLTLARDYETLRTQELKIQRALSVAYQAVFVTYAEIEDLRAQREAFGEQVKANFQEFQAGKITPDVLLEAQRFWASALSQEYQAITDYNNSLAVFELVKGTIAQHDNVVIAEGRCRSASPSGRSSTSGSGARPWKGGNGPRRCRWPKRTLTIPSRTCRSAPTVTPPRCPSFGRTCRR